MLNGPSISFFEVRRANSETCILCIGGACLLSYQHHVVFGAYLAGLALYIMLIICLFMLPIQDQRWVKVKIQTGAAFTVITGIYTKISCAANIIV